MLCEMQSVSSRIWTRIAMSNSYDDNHYSTVSSCLVYAYTDIPFCRSLTPPRALRLSRRVSALNNPRRLINKIKNGGVYASWDWRIELKILCRISSAVPYSGGARGVMVIVVENGHGDTSSNPGRNWLHSSNTIGKSMNPIILPPAMGKY